MQTIEIKPGETVVLTVDGVPYGVVMIDSVRTWQGGRMVEFVGAGVTVEGDGTVLGDGWRDLRYPGSFAATRAVTVKAQTPEAVDAAFTADRERSKG